MTIGIYCIENTINNKKYIGSSFNIASRLKHHKNSLDRHAHYNKELQSDWVIDQRVFRFYIIRSFTEITIEDLRMHEQNEIIKHETYNVQTAKVITLDDLRKLSAKEILVIDTESKDEFKCKIIEDALMYFNTDIEYFDCIFKGKYKEIYVINSKYTSDIKI